MSDTPPPDYSLVMPFVVVASAGGPYDDGAFVAGCRFGTWDALLTLKPVMHAEYEPPELVPQLDLLAMHHGYTMTTEPFDDDWTYVEMRRNGTVPQEGQADE